MINKEFKIGDLVETCSLLPAIIQDIDEFDNISCYSFEFINNNEYNGRTSCSLEHCGIRKISHEFALKLLTIGKPKLTELYNNSKSYDDYDKLVDNEYQKIINLQ